MLYVIALLWTAAVSIQARTFNNPILSDKHYYQPGAIKVNGTYYVVASNPFTNDGIFPIHTSTDLMEWKSAGYVFNASNSPAWTHKDSLISPEIHQIGSNFVLYFSACNITYDYWHVGVATGLHPLGPYTAADLPMLVESNLNSYYPSIIKDKENLYLIWSSSWRSINARQLTANGLNFSSDQTTSLLKHSLAWEEGAVHSPWYIRRGSYHYLMYNGGCNGVGVARSDNPLGPYEKHPDPIIVPNGDFVCPNDVSAVKDLDDENDVIFSNAVLSGTWTVVLASVSWSAEGWPYVDDF